MDWFDVWKPFALIAVAFLLGGPDRKHDGLHILLGLVLVAVALVFAYLSGSQILLFMMLEEFDRVRNVSTLVMGYVLILSVLVRRGLSFLGNRN